MIYAWILIQLMTNFKVGGETSVVGNGLTPPLFSLFLWLWLLFIGVFFFYHEREPKILFNVILGHGLFFFSFVIFGCKGLFNEYNP